MTHRSDGAENVGAALQRLRQNLTRSGEDPRWPRGAVGAWDGDGGALYGYPETAGYWLRWASRRADVEAQCGQRVVVWLQRLYAEHGGWPTRVAVTKTALDPMYTDARYLFDHIMLWDGLRRWADARRSPAASQLAEQVWQCAGIFACGGQLLAATTKQRPGTGALHKATAAPGHVGGRRSRGAAVTNCPDGSAPAQRWSSQIGPYLLKVCARVRNGCMDEPSDRLVSACAQIEATLLTAGVEAAHDQAHPQLYAIEGMIELGLTAPALAATRALINAHGGLAGLRERVRGGPRRRDVLAQALRAGCLLGLATPDDPDWQALAQELAAAVDAGGRLAFAAGSDVSPAWAALFAEQALSLWLGDSIAAAGVV